MSISRKYGRTYHYPFSPGTTSDDRISFDYWRDIQQVHKVIHTEKLDGENNCLNKQGVFARSHAAPTTSPWTSHLRQKWELIHHDLGDYEIFGENLYAIHSIEYKQLENYFFVFAVREKQQWLSWEETCFVAGAFDLPLVPVLKTCTDFTSQAAFEQEVLSLTQEQSIFQSTDVQTQEPCTIEGIVTRNMDAYSIDDFQHHVFKYVRKGHVKTDEHWTRNWKRAKLKFEKNVDIDK